MYKLRAFAILLLITFAVQLDAQTISMGHLSIPLSNPGKPYSLTVELGAADLNVSVYSGPDISIDVIRNTAKTGGRERPNLALSTGDESLSTREKNNEVSITNATPAREMLLLNIKIPAGASRVKLSVNSGKLVASNISGDIEASNTHGNLTLNNISGSAVASTNDGELGVTFKSVDPNAALAFSSLRGTVSVTLPANLRENVKLRSERGYVYSFFEIATEKSAIKPGRDGARTLFTWKTGDWLNGKIGGGGQELIIKNYRGHIYLRKAN